MESHETRRALHKHSIPSDQPTYREQSLREQRIQMVYRSGHTKVRLRGCGCTRHVLHTRKYTWAWDLGCSMSCSMLNKVVVGYANSEMLDSMPLFTRGTRAFLGLEVSQYHITSWITGLVMDRDVQHIGRQAMSRACRAARCVYKGIS